MTISWHWNISIWGVNQKAKGWNVCAVCSGFILDEHIWRKSPITERAILRFVWGFFFIYTHLNLNLSPQRQHSSLLPLYWHQTGLCWDVMQFSPFNGRVKFWSENPPSQLSKMLWKKLICHFWYKNENQIRFCPICFSIPTGFTNTYSGVTLEPLFGQFFSGCPKHFDCYS